MSPKHNESKRTFGIWVFWVGMFALLLLRLVPNLPVWIGYGFFALLIVVLLLDQLRHRYSPPHS